MRISDWSSDVCSSDRVEMASLSGQLMLQRKLYIRNQYKFTLSWEYCLLEPMDVVTLTDARLGLAQRPVRIVELEEDDQGNLAFTAEDFIAGIGQATAYPKQQVSNTPINAGIPAPEDRKSTRLNSSH